MSSTEPSFELSDAASFRSRLLALSAATTLVTVVVGALFFFFGLDLSPRQLRLGPILIAGPAFVVDLAVGLFAVHRLAAPVVRGLDLRPGRSEPFGSTALVRALNLPALSALRVALLQTPAFALVAGVLMVVGSDAWALGFRADQVLVAMLTILLIGGGHAIVEYFLVAAAARPVVRILRERGITLDRSAQERVITVGMRRKFLFVSAFAVFVPMMVLGFSVLLKAERLMAAAGVADASLRIAPLRVWVVLLIAVTTAIVLYMSVVMGREVIVSTEVLVHAMHKVRENRLDTELAITTTDEFAQVYEGFNRMTVGLRERERLHDAVGRYVAPELADQVMRDGMKLGGETVEATVLFADIRSFTALSEQMTPAQIVDLLNRYFAAVEPVIVSEGGWINKFGGDSILAVFGAPVRSDEHAVRAVRAARAMRGALGDFNAQQRRRGATELRIGIGIAAGTLVAGNVGSPRRMEYTVIGDVVNTAARLEALTKKVGRPVLVSGSVRQALGDAFEGDALPAARVPGKADPIEVYALAES